MRILFLMMLAAFASQQAGPQTNNGVIEGVVVRRVTKEPVSDVHLTLTGLQDAAVFGVPLAAVLLLVQNPQPIKILPRFDIGEVLHLEIQKAREDSRNPSLGSSSTAVDLHVVDVDADGFILDWVYGETRVQNERAPAKPSVNLTTDYTNLRIRIVVKPDGGFYLQNSGDFSERIRIATDAMIERAVLSLPENIPAPENAVEQAPVPSIVDRTDLVYSGEKGFFEKIGHEFTITAGSFRRVHRIEISTTRRQQQP